MENTAAIAITIPYGLLQAPFMFYAEVAGKISHSIVGFPFAIALPLPTVVITQVLG